ncbi:NADAR family protein [Bacillus glycinifermentans]|uniref:NADAR family protein n=1 Tax=Bacillus glycinifermentans TaxID=1664069 RepID=UPI001581E009|nr:NADAR family protein [Bacillus glycinifermentans]NUJ19468.1 NADAR family protein [Bacillus glycinifermentans]
MDVIDEFKGKHYFLSNFYSAPVMYQGITYQNNEAAFQAMKVTDKSIHLEFSELPPNLAKRKGRRVKLRPDWEEAKETFMYEIVKAKFEQNAHLKNKLLQTGESILIEGNTWGDKIWGVCDGVGENKLGKILMKVRNELKRRTDGTDQSI